MGRGRSVHGKDREYVKNGFKKGIHALICVCDIESPLGNAMCVYMVYVSAGSVRMIVLVMCVCCTLPAVFVYV
jgi:hypothetical protein